MIICAFENSPSIPSFLVTKIAYIEFFMVTHNAIPSGPGGVPVWMINASIMESMDCSDQNTEPKMFGSTKKAYGDFCLAAIM